MAERPSDSGDQPELPFIIGILGDFVGHGTAPRLADRGFVDIDAASFAAVFRTLGPSLTLTVDNALQADGTMLQIALRFTALDDFGPDGVARQLQPLAAALGERARPAGTTGLFDQLLRQGGSSPLDQAIAATQHGKAAPVDSRLVRQIEAIRHDPAFRQLEASWRGLHLLVSRSAGVQTRLFQASEDELAKALRSDPDSLFEQLMNDAPLGLLLGDYAFSHEPQPVETLGLLADLAASAAVPMLAGISSRLFGVDRLADLAKLRDGDLRRSFDRPDFAKWRSLRDRDEARYLTLVLPRIAVGPADGGPVWVNGAYLLAARMAESFAATGWCLALEGPAGRFEPELEIEGEREALLSKLGLVSLARPRASGELQFFGLQTLQKPREYDDPAISRNAALATELPCLMAMARCIQGIAALGGDALAAGVSLDECAARLNGWIGRFVGSEPDLVSTGDPGRPLREARITVATAADRTIYAEARIWPRLPRQTLSAALKLRVPLS
jgi:type VI secretion system protein ImpC